MNDNFPDDPLYEKKKKIIFRKRKNNFFVIHTRGNPTYSSILKVTTYLNDNSLVLTNSINFLYVPKGVLPAK